jgi:hypothetical protein
MSVPRCAARRRDGRECGALASSPTATYCRRHEQLAADLGDDAVQTGSYPRRRTPREELLLVVNETPAAQTVPTTDTAITPSEVRPRLAQVTAESVAEIQTALLDAALGATCEHWVTFTCPDCGKKHPITGRSRRGTRRSTRRRRERSTGAASRRQRSPPASAAGRQLKDSARNGTADQRPSSFCCKSSATVRGQLIRARVDTLALAEAGCLDRHLAQTHPPVVAVEKDVAELDVAERVAGREHSSQA